MCCLCHACLAWPQMPADGLPASRERGLLLSVVYLDRSGLGLFPAVGCTSQPTWGTGSQASSGAAGLFGHWPQVQHVAPGWDGEGPQRQRSPHCRAPCSIETQRVGSRSCRSTEALSEPNRSRRGVDNTGSPEEIASDYSIRKGPVAVLSTRGLIPFLGQELSESPLV